jgi:MFS transporter, AAHS family, 3-hydroxyphenylpropionic acid transporter
VKTATATVVCCFLAALCEGFDLQAAGVAAAGIAEEFKPTPDQLGTFFSASTLGLFLGALLGGRLADSIGRKRTLLASIGVFGAISLLTAFGWGIDSLTVARLMTGLGLGGAFPTLMAWVNEQSAPNRRRANVALVYAAMPLGGAVVSFMTLLIPSDRWRLVFVAGGVAPLMLLPIVQSALRESQRHEGAAPAASAAALEPAVALAESNMPKAGSFIAIFKEGRALPTVLLWVCCVLGQLTLYLLLSWLPTLLIGMGFAKSQASLAQIGFNVGGALSAWMLGQLLEGRWRTPSLIATFIAAPLLIYLLSLSPGAVWVVVIIAFSLGGALIAAQGYYYASAPIVYPTTIRGVGSGATVAAGRLGSVMGPKLGGILRTLGHSSTQLFGDLVPLVMLGSLAGFAFALINIKKRVGTVQADRGIV